MMKILTLSIFLASAKAACDNACSGHGTCMTDDVCQCFDNWGIGLSHDSGDCSERICPFELAWVDTPDERGHHHRYAECAGRGICNRDTAECTCFDGYEGKACQRTSCPNDCSGHGTCEYIEDLGFAATWHDYDNEDFNVDKKTFAYPQWDRGKIRGCVCDALYADVDCSKIMCPYGTDVLDTRNDLLVDAKYQVQELFFKALTNGATFTDYTEPQDAGGNFALTFKSRLNETFTTIPIVYKPENLPDFVNDIQLALLNLPNKVIDGVKVAAGIYAAENLVHVNITFTGDSVQGPQYPLTVHDYECSAGCTPKLKGLLLESRYYVSVTKPWFHSNYTESRKSDFNSFECGRRGKCDYSTGLCSCFTGYTGDNCNTLSTLV